MNKFKPFIIIIFYVLSLSSCNSGDDNNASSGNGNVAACTSSNEIIIENTSRSGALNQHELWRGNITVTGDILIGSGCKLTIEAGTNVKFTAKSDSTSQGGNTPITDSVFPNDPANKPSEMSGIDLFGGELVAVGTLNNLIIFSSNAASPTAGDWHSIAFRDSASKLTIEYAQISHAYYGIQISDTATNNTVVIKNNTINNIVGCGICMGVDINKKVTLTVSGNTISACGHEGIDLHANASIIIENNNFFNNRGKFVTDPTSIGGNGVVVDKSNNSIIRNNTFENNNQGIACVTDGSNPTITGNTFGTGGNANDENIQTCPR